MKILFTIYRSLGYGGAEVSTRYLAEALEKKGHNVIIASTQKYAKLNTIIFKEFHKKSFFFQEKYLTNFLIKVIKKEKISIIHAQDRLTSIPAIKAAKKCNIPIVVNFRDHWVACPKSSCVAPNGYRYNKCSYKTIIKHYPLNRWLTDFYKWHYLKKSWKTINKADVKIANSEIVKNKLRLCGITNIKVIHPFRDKKDFQNIKNSKEFKNKYKLKTKVILFVGSFFYTKGISLLMKIMPIITKQNKDVCFLLIGDGPMLNDVKDMVKKRKLEKQIIMPGRILYRDISKAYKISDIVVMPTNWEEPFSGIPLEASASKKTFIANKIGGITELKRKDSFILIEKDNIEEWVQNINKLIKNKKLRERMGKNAYDIFIKNYDSSVIIKKILNIYKKTIGD